jgi:hypothetical protein
MPTGTKQTWHWHNSSTLLSSQETNTTTSNPTTKDKATEGATSLSYAAGFAVSNPNFRVRPAPPDLPPALTHTVIRCSSARGEPADRPRDPRRDPPARLLPAVSLYPSGAPVPNRQAVTLGDIRHLTAAGRLSPALAPAAPYGVRCRGPTRNVRGRLSIVNSRRPGVSRPARYMPEWSA